MKISLCAMNALVCTLFVALVIVLLLHVAYANDYTHEADIYIERTTHDRAIVTHSVTRVTKYRTIHTGAGSHQHPDPKINTFYTDVTCSSSQCSYCY